MTIKFLAMGLAVVKGSGGRVSQKQAFTSEEGTFG